jgi:YHS domain-containing protein
MPKTLITLLPVALVLASAIQHVSAQQLDPNERIGSKTDMCEELRFERISGLLDAGKLTDKQAHQRWQRISSDKVAVQALLTKAVKAGELTSSQADKLMPLLDMQFVAEPLAGRPHIGKFGVNKTLPAGTFRDNVVSQENCEKVFQRLVAANKRGEIYDYDASSIMLALLTGWDWRKHTAEEEYAYKRMITPRWQQAEEGGFMSKDRVMVGFEKKRDNAATKGRGGRDGYGKGPLKIEDPAAWTKALGKPIFSGPQPGEKLPPFQAIGLTGALEGQDFDAAALAGDELHMLIFAKEARTFGRFISNLARQLSTIESNSKRKWEMSFIVVNDDPNDVEQKFEWVKRSLPDFVRAGLSKDGSDGPPTYGLDRTLTATVIVAKDGKVVHNLPYISNAFYTQPHILGAIAGAMDVDHETLQKYLANTAGDQASAAARGQRNRGGMTNDQQAFRSEIGRRVKAGEITREEASKLYRDKFGDRAKSSKRQSQPEAKKSPINTKCPVTGKAVTADSPTTEYRGRTVALCCNKCKAKFEADPDKYAPALRRR